MFKREKKELKRVKGAIFVYLATSMCCIFYRSQRSEAFLRVFRTSNIVDEIGGRFGTIIMKIERVQSGYEDKRDQERDSEL